MGYYSGKIVTQKSIPETITEDHPGAGLLGPQQIAGADEDCLELGNKLKYE